MKWILVLMLGLAACGESKVVWDCTCTAMCGSSSASDTEKGCGTKDEAQAAVDQAVKDCVTALDSACTGGGTCECTCSPTETTCE
jgi:hypothetical protein